jgi:ABC-type antimicrobial peptide transport system permease subunit
MSETTKKGSTSKYEYALQLLFYEGQIAWQMNVLFIGLNVGIGTIVQDKLNSFKSGDTLLILMSLVGVIINVFWLGTFRRNNSYYHFRMAQARSAENVEWKLLNEDGYNFSKGKPITL